MRTRERKIKQEKTTRVQHSDECFAIPLLGIPDYTRVHSHSANSVIARRVITRESERERERERKKKKRKKDDVIYVTLIFYLYFRLYFIHVAVASSGKRIYTGEFNFISCEVISKVYLVVVADGVRKVKANDRIEK